MTEAEQLLRFRYYVAPLASKSFSGCTYVDKKVKRLTGRSCTFAPGRGRVKTRNEPVFGCHFTPPGPLRSPYAAI